MLTVAFVVSIRNLLRIFKVDISLKRSEKLIKNIFVGMTFKCILKAHMTDTFTVKKSD